IARLGRPFAGNRSCIARLNAHGAMACRIAVARDAACRGLAADPATGIATVALDHARVARRARHVLALVRAIAVDDAIEPRPAHLAGAARGTVAVHHALAVGAGTSTTRARIEAGLRDARRLRIRDARSAIVLDRVRGHALTLTGRIDNAGIAGIANAIEA